MSKYEKQEVIDTDKVKAVISSCRNIEQLRGAYKYFKLWQKKYKTYIDQNKALLYIEGIMLGRIKGMREVYEQRTIS